MTPPHSVLSRSRTTHLANMPEAASTVSSSDCARQRQVLEPARRLRHVPHAGVEPARPADRGGEEIDVVQRTFLVSRALTANR